MTPSDHATAAVNAGDREDDMDPENMDPTIPDDDELPEGATRAADGSINILAPGAYKRIKDKALARGKAAAQAEYEAKMKSLEEENTRLRTPQNVPPSAPPSDPGPAPEHLSPKAKGAWDRERGQIVAERDRMARESEKWRQNSTKWEKRANEHQADAQHRDDTLKLHKAAWSAGVQDTDYAVHLLDQHIAEMPDDEVKKMPKDFAKTFFEGLKSTKPFIFGTTVQPMSTAPSVPNTPAAPKPGEVSARQASEGQVNVKKMNPQEYREHLHKQGLKHPGD